MIASTYSTSSFTGFVSSNRRLHFPPKSRAIPKSIIKALAEHPFYGEKIQTVQGEVVEDSRAAARAKVDAMDLHDDKDSEGVDVDDAIPTSVS